MIPGARGCTPQNCAFRDHYAELQSLGATVYGLSTQPTPYEKGMVQGLVNLPASRHEGRGLVKPRQPSPC